jgi:hypothetical protein
MEALIPLRDGRRTTDRELADPLPARWRVPTEAQVVTDEAPIA